MGHYFSIDTYLPTSSLQYPIPKNTFNQTIYDDKETKFYLLPSNIDSFKISICVIKPFNLKKTTKTNNIIIFSHGNATDIFNMHPYLKHLAYQTNSIIVCYDYPGYSLSTGIPKKKTCINSLYVTVEFVKEKIGKNILLVGQSLGTGIVCEFVKKHNWKKPIVLISPYRSIAQVGSEMLLGTSYFIDYVVEDNYLSYECLKTFNYPVKIYHGIDDDLISIKHGKDLWDVVKNKTLEPVWFENCGHNDILERIDNNDFKLLVEMQHK